MKIGGGSGAAELVAQKVLEELEESKGEKPQVVAKLPGALQETVRDVLLREQQSTWNRLLGRGAELSRVLTSDVLRLVYQGLGVEPPTNPPGYNYHLRENLARRLRENADRFPADVLGTAASRAAFVREADEFVRRSAVDSAAFGPGGFEAMRSSDAYVEARDLLLVNWDRLRQLGAPVAAGASIVGTTRAALVQKTAAAAAESLHDCQVLQHQLGMEVRHGRPVDTMSRLDWASPDLAQRARVVAVESASKIAQILLDEVGVNGDRVSDGQARNLAQKLSKLGAALWAEEVHPGTHPEMGLLDRVYREVWPKDQIRYGLSNENLQREAVWAVATVLASLREVLGDTTVRPPAGG